MDRSEELTWLQGLKVGDEVAVGSRHSAYVQKITRATKTQVVAGTTRYNRKTGKAVGTNGWSATYIRPVSQELKDQLERDRLCAKIRIFLESGPRREVLTLGQLRNIWGNLQEAENESLRKAAK